MICDIKKNNSIQIKELCKFKLRKPGYDNDLTVKKKKFKHEGIWGMDISGKILFKIK